MALSTTLLPLTKTLNHTSQQLTFAATKEPKNNTIANTTELTLSKKQRRNIEDDYNMYEEDIQLDILWETAQSNQWYEWATFTATDIQGKNCLFCSKSPASQVIIVPNPFDFEKCAEMNRLYCNMKMLKPTCPAECLGFLSNAKDRLMYRHIRQLAARCKGIDISKIMQIQNNQKIEIPQWYTIDYSKEYECFVKTTGDINMGQFKGKCKIIWTIDKTKLRQAGDSLDFHPTRSSGIRKGKKIVPEKNCENQTIALPDADTYKDQTQAIADFFWVCGHRKLLPFLPKGWKGTCTRVRLIQEIQIIEWDFDNKLEKKDTSNHRVKRSYEPDPKVYLDPIGQPRGVPNQFKARDEVKSGFESIFIWISQNKNTEWINYIYYNQQRFINHTNEALMSLGEQLDATSKMTWQNRLALNWILADKNGVCILFGNQCCTFIPNNTSPEGTFTKAMAKLKDLQTEMENNAGRDEEIWDWFDLKLGAWGAWFAKLGIFLGVASSIGGLLFCCVIPLLKVFIIKATVKQMEVLRYQDDRKLKSQNNQSVYYEDLLYKTVMNLQLVNENSSTSDEDGDPGL